MNDRPTILLLGGSSQQVIAIETAKHLGYRTILCDYLEDNPGQNYADSFYLVSTTDRDAILEVAETEGIDGILAYSSDPAAPIAAYVAERLELPTNPLRAVEIMSTKNLFRRHLEQEGLPCPRSLAFKSSDNPRKIYDLLEDLSFPIVVKPTDSSGSKGVTVVQSPNQVEEAISYATTFSRNGVLIAEEYIDRAFPHVIGGDIFVLEGKVVFWGIMSCVRDKEASLVPMGEKMPSGLSNTQYASVKETLQELVTSLGIRFGELNVEIIIGKDGTPYVLELGSRAGGNMIPVQLSDASGIDLVAANVLCAMGDKPEDIFWEPSDQCFATYVLHSQYDGVYEGYDLSAEASPCLYREVLYCNPGDRAERFDGANKALGILFFRFEDEAQMNRILDNACAHICVKVRES